MRTEYNDAEFIQIKKFWPQGRDYPLAFCNIEGREGGAVSGNKKSSLLSKSNSDEAKKVVRFLVSKYHFIMYYDSNVEFSLFVNDRYKHTYIHNILSI